MQTAAFGRLRWLQGFDWGICALVVAISLLGLLQVYSATLNTKFQGAYWQHCIWLVLGLGLFLVVSHINYHRAVEVALLLWVAGIVLLVAVLLFAQPVNGARRWLPLPGGFSVQVSEFMKVVLVLVAAKYCSELSTRSMQFRDVAVCGTLFLVPVLLVVRQPDLSTALSMLPIAGMALYLAKVKTRHVVAVLLVCVLLAPLGWSLLQPYQKARITGFLDPTQAPRSTGYQILQAKIAVGAGGIWGQGFVQGSQTQLRFLPTPHTDFILAAFAEERGFVGVSIVLALYFGLLLRVAQVGRTAADREGTRIAMCVAAVLLFHTVVNVGMVANKLPVTGLPLPLMSYGGSNLLAVLIMLGLVHSVHIRRFVN